MQHRLQLPLKPSPPGMAHADLLSRQWPRTCTRGVLQLDLLMDIDIDHIGLPREIFMDIDIDYNGLPRR
eukprot:10888452-Heterocapsa_arctica.AAC.1